MVNRNLTPYSRVLIENMRKKAQARLGMEAWLARQAEWEREYERAREIAREDAEWRRRHAAAQPDSGGGGAE